MVLANAGHDRHSTRRHMRAIGRRFERRGRIVFRTAELRLSYSAVSPAGGGARPHGTPPTQPRGPPVQEFVESTFGADPGPAYSGPTGPRCIQSAGPNGTAATGVGGQFRARSPPGMGPTPSRGGTSQTTRPGPNGRSQEIRLSRGRAPGALDQLSPTTFAPRARGFASTQQTRWIMRGGRVVRKDGAQALRPPPRKKTRTQKFYRLPLPHGRGWAGGRQKKILPK